MQPQEARAVLYARMSTDMQEQSLDNQSSAISLYASHKGLQIVRRYEDAGRSGLTLANRPALKRLLHDVHGPDRDFEVVLVYDISRWGRFQDADESAYYEFICRNAGVRVEYCAEAFENDGSLTATVLKNIKRAMAGEFSRELSAKVFAGQSRSVSRGFHSGSTPGFGLRRYLIDSNGNPKFPLDLGERKSVQTERVILVPGPVEETSLVKRVYNLFTERQETLRGIAAQLNSQGHKTSSGKPWSATSIREMLTNEKYIGNSVYNRTSRKLGQKWQRNPRDSWIRSVGAFQPIIASEQFAKAQFRIARIRERNIYSDGDLLNALTAVWCSAGRLTNLIVERSRYCPSTNTYKSRFQSLARAFARIGYPPPKRTGFNLNLRKSICEAIAVEVTEAGGVVSKLPGSCQLLVNNEVVVTVVAGRSPRYERPQNQWRFGYRSRRRPDVLVVARVDPAGRVVDYYILPYLFLARGAWITVSGKNYERLDSFRTETLAPLTEILARLRPECLR